MSTQPHTYCINDRLAAAEWDDSNKASLQLKLRSRVSAQIEQTTPVTHCVRPHYRLSA